MSRSGWYDIAAFGGIAALSVALVGYGALGRYGHPNQKQGQPHADRAHYAATVSPSTFAAYPVEQSNHCYQSPNHDSADLCAQWRAAIAAEKSADAAWGALILSIVSLFCSIVGLLFLFWQISLTRQAVKDTGLATDAMREANSIANASAKPYIVISLGDFSLQNTALGDMICFNIIASNVGGAGCVLEAIFHNWGKREYHPSVLMGMDQTIPLPSGQDRPVKIDPIVKTKQTLLDEPVMRGFARISGPLLSNKERIVRFSFEVFTEITYPHLLHYKQHNDPEWFALDGPD